MIKENRKKCTEFATIVLQTAAISLALFLLKKAVFLFADRTNFSDRMASMGAMVVMSAVILIVAKNRKWELSVFPEKFGVPYIIATAIAAAIFIVTPSNFQGSWQPIAVLFYGSVVTPVFEELIFRGIMWNRLKGIFKSEWTVYAVDALLFGMWHLGYTDSVAFRVNDGLANIMFWKVITGLCFGIVLGILRKYTKSCYATMLLHGVLNTIGK